MAKPELADFAHFIEKELGIVYSEANLFQLEHRLERVMQFTGLPTLDELWKRVREGSDRALCAQILDASTNNETSFFRDKGIFAAFEHLAVPEMLKLNSNQLKIWSAACSTGQEPYSLSMILTENGANLGVSSWTILATDYSERALARAKAGKYSQLEIQRGLPASRLIKCFDKLENDEWVIRPDFKTNLRFQRLNLLSSPSFADTFDIIFLRNMLIYQSVENKRKIVSQVASHLKPRGCLFLGSAESLMGISDAFEQVSSDGAFFYRKRT